MQIQSLIPLLDGGSIVISTSSYLINHTPIIVGYILNYDSQLKYEGVYHYVDDVKTVTKGELLTTDELEQLKLMLSDYHKQSELKQIILDFLNTNNMKIIKVNTHRDGGSKQLDIQIDNYIVQVLFKRVRQTESEIAYYKYPKLKFKDKKLSFEDNQFGLTVDKLKELITDYKDFLEMKSDLKQELIKTISIK